MHGNTASRVGRESSKGNSAVRECRKDSDVIPEPATGEDSTANRVVRCTKHRGLGAPVVSLRCGSNSP